MLHLNKFFLIGFMGSGKTHWGKLWAERNGYWFYDLDAVIEANEHRTIAELFDKHGEERFRELEAATLRSFEDKDQFILSSGGGTACFHENMQWMNQQGSTVYLKAPAPVLLERVLEEKASRPLIRNLNQAELLFFIEQKLKEREPFYSRARYTIDNEQVSAEIFKLIVDGDIKFA